MQLDKLEGVDSKYNNITFKFQPKDNKLGHFWYQI